MSERTNLVHTISTLARQLAERAEEIRALDGWEEGDEQLVAASEAIEQAIDLIADATDALEGDGWVMESELADAKGRPGVTHPGAPVQVTPAPWEER